MTEGGRPSKVARVASSCDAAAAASNAAAAASSAAGGAQDGSTLELVSVLRMLPFGEQLSIWGRLDYGERRSLRQSSRALRDFGDSCVRKATFALTPPQSQLACACGGVPDAAAAAGAGVERQMLSFPSLRTLELACMQAGAWQTADALYARPSLARTWQRLQELRLRGFNGIGARPLRLACAFQQLKVLTLNTVHLEVGSLQSLSDLPSLSSLHLKSVTLRSRGAILELAHLCSLTDLKLDSCQCLDVHLDLRDLSTLQRLQTIEVTHMDSLAGVEWRSDLGDSLALLPELRCVRLDAGEYGVVVETDGILADDVQLQYNAALLPMASLHHLRSLAMDFLLSDDGWSVVVSLPCLVELIVEGVNLSTPCERSSASLEQLTLNKVTPAQLVKILPMPSLQRLHIIFVNVTATTPEQLESTAVDLAAVSKLLAWPHRHGQQGEPEAAQREASLGEWVYVEDAGAGAGAGTAGAAGAASSSGCGPSAAAAAAAPAAASTSASTSAAPAAPAAAAREQSPQPLPPNKLEIWAGLQLVAENPVDHGDLQLAHMGKQRGAGRLVRSLRPLAPYLRTLCLQCMSVMRADAADVLASLPQLQELVLMSCGVEALLLQSLHPGDRSLHRISLLYGCSYVSAAQVLAFCLGACASRASAQASRLPLSPVLELEISMDSMEWEEQAEAQRVLTPYADLLTAARMRVIFATDQDLNSAPPGAAGGAAAGGAGAGANAAAAAVAELFGGDAGIFAGAGDLIAAWGAGPPPLPFAVPVALGGGGWEWGGGGGGGGGALPPPVGVGLPAAAWVIGVQDAAP